MKRVFCLDSCMTSGGAEHQLCILMDMLVERGYSVTYATFVDADDHYRINSSIKRVRIASSKPKFIKLVAVFLYMLFVKTDIVIAFSQRLSVMTLLPLIFRPKIKVISSERNYTINKASIYEKILVRTKLYKRATYIVSNSYSQAEYLSLLMPSIKNKVSTITNFTDINKYIYTPLPHNEIKRVGLFCRVEEQKNLHRFIEAINILKESDILSFHVDWYGRHTFNNPVQTEYFSKGLELIKKYKLERYISFHDPSREVEKLLPTFDVLCLPSLCEGFSNSISEYICCGRPVLCSDVSDNKIMVHHGVNGFLFDPLDVMSIANTIRDYMSLSVEENDYMGRKSREIACTLFEKERFINSYINLIES